MTRTILSLAKLPPSPKKSNLCTHVLHFSLLYPLDGLPFGVYMASLPVYFVAQAYGRRQGNVDGEFQGWKGEKSRDGSQQRSIH